MKEITCFVIFISLISFISCATKINKVDKMPLWAKSQTISTVFPNNDFIATIGFGADKELASLHADSELSLYFSYFIENKISANEFLSNERDLNIRKREILKSVFIKNSTKLFALRHTEYYFDKQLNQYIVCAYINRNEALNLIEPKLTSESIKIERLYEESKKQEEPFLKILLLNSILYNSNDFYNLYFFLYGIKQENAKLFSYIDNMIQTVYLKNKKLKQNAVIFIDVHGDVSNRIKTKFYELFSKSGFVVADCKNSNAAYILDINVDAIISNTDEIFISYPKLSAFIKRTDGIILSSFSKQFEKISSYKKESCERMILKRMENEVEKNFFSECLNQKNCKEG